MSEYQAAILVGVGNLLHLMVGVLMEAFNVSEAQAYERLSAVCLDAANAARLARAREN